MIITIDISQIPYQTGVSRYTESLVENLLQIDKKNHYQLFAGVFQEKRQIELFAEYLRDQSLDFKLIIKIFPPKLAATVWNKWHIFPIENFIGKSDIFHTSDWTQPPTKNSLKITTIHDLTPIIFPQYHEDFIIQNFRQNLKLIEKEVSHIIAVSHSTASDLKKHTSISPEKISVVPEAASSLFSPKKNTAKINQLKLKYGIKKHYILSVGTLEPRKNLKSLISVFQKLNPRDYQLLIVGKKGWGRQLEVDNQNVIFTDFIDDYDLPNLYAGASFFVYPSFYEGFGLPVLEAMQSGLAVITSNVSSLPEIVDSSGILINPHNLSEIKAAIKNLIADEKLRKNLSQKSIKRASQFSWQETAKKTLAIYQKLC